MNTKPPHQSGNYENTAPQEQAVQYISLHPTLLEAVCHALASLTGKPSAYSTDLLSAVANSQSDPGDISLAIAYANLLAEDPDTVTQHHLKMLRNRFSVEQIKELTSFIHSYLNA